jgi:A/G-specific adenine glycosylase
MLQQTQVSRIIPFYENFIKKFPDLDALARAKTADVLQAWQGLGYNRRALALQKLAKKIVETKEYKGRLPRDRAALESLPGVGPYTAGAIRAFAFNEPEIFIETNIRRVFIHFFFPRGKKVTDAELHRYIERMLERKNPREWYYALMDYGAMLGDGARENPNRRSAHYVRQSKFFGSDREIRGKILRMLLAGATTKQKIPASSFPRKIVLGLEKDGFVIQRGKYIQLA